MATIARSCSKPDQMIGRKQIDWSMFEYGTNIPSEFREDFAAANGGETPAPNESRPCNYHWLVVVQESKVNPRPTAGG